MGATSFCVLTLGDSLIIGGTNLHLIGVVVIGRNEGKRLHQCLLSVIGKGITVVYVDSGSTDASVALARFLGVHVVELDLSIPFTAGRARNAGFEYLLQVKPEVEYVQFVDGDCWIVEGWLERAASELDVYPEVVVVCGRRREEFAENSIYNRLLDIEWNTPVGEAKACGGDSMIRVGAFKKVGGFNPSLIAGEEPELCVRLRQAGGKILRVDTDMTWHDGQMTRFDQWWKRSVRSGYGYAEGAWLHGCSPDRHWLKESLRIWIWSLVLPLLAIATFFPTHGLSILLLLLANLFSGYRAYGYTRSRGFAAKDAIAYGLFCILGKYPQLVGQSQFYLLKLFKRQPTIVEYKGAF